MKTSMINRILAVALLSFFTMVSAAPAFANNEKAPAPVVLKYIGKISNQPVFELTVTGDDVKEFDVTITDKDNVILYRGSLKANSSKKFLLDTEELGDSAVKFEISGKKTETIVYQINRNSRTIEDVVVNKIK